MVIRRIFHLFTIAILIISFCLTSFFPVYASEAFIKFDDTKTHWAKNNIIWAYQHNIVAGTSSTSFSPDMPVTMAMFLTMLYNYDGRQSMDSILDTPYINVNKTDYYYNAVKFAHHNSLITSSVFDPNQKLSRGEVAEILFRYFYYDYRKSFPDGPLISIDIPPYPQKYIDVEPYGNTQIDRAMRFFVSEGVIVGKSQNTINLDDIIIRAEVVTIIKNYDDLV